jgi:hypothetical protein
VSLGSAWCARLVCVLVLVIRFWFSNPLDLLSRWFFTVSRLVYYSAWFVFRLVFRWFVSAACVSPGLCSAWIVMFYGFPLGLCSYGFVFRLVCVPLGLCPLCVLYIPLGLCSAFVVPLGLCSAWLCVPLSLMFRFTCPAWFVFQQLVFRLVYVIPAWFFLCSAWFVFLVFVFRVCVPLGLCSAWFVSLGLCSALVCVPLGFVFRLVCVPLGFGVPLVCVDFPLGFVFCMVCVPLVCVPRAGSIVFRLGFTCSAWFVFHGLFPLGFNVLNAWFVFLGLMISCLVLLFRLVCVPLFRLVCVPLVLCLTVCVPWFVFRLVLCSAWFVFHLV